MPDSPYRGYKSYSYLTPADDYPVFDLGCPATSPA